MKQRDADDQSQPLVRPPNATSVGTPMPGYLRVLRFRLRQPGETDDVLAARRPYYFGIVLLGLLSLLFRQPLLFVGAILLLALIVIPEIWYRYGLRLLTIERQPATRRAVFGDTTEISLVIENRKPLPLPSLELSDDFPDALPVYGLRLRLSSKQETAILPNLVALWAYQRLRRRYRVHAVARGAYRFGPMTIRVSDPFGILTREKVLDMPAVLLVHPLVAPIERFGLPSQAPFGERKSPRRLLEDPLRVSGIRAYEPGDEPRRIHWKATARTGTLQSKVYEPATRHTVALFLESRTYPRALMGYDPVLIELLVSATASVAMWGLDQGYAVGLYSNGNVAMPEFDSEQVAVPSATKPSQAGTTTDAPEMDWSEQRLRATAALRLRLPPASRTEQGTRLLDGLARLLPYYGHPMHDIISTEAARLPFGTTIVYIGTETAVDVPLILALRQLRARGHGVTLLLARSDVAGGDGDAPDGTLHLADLPVHYIGGRERWHELESDVLGPDAGRKATSVITSDGPSSAMPSHGTSLNSTREPARDAGADRSPTTQRTEQRGASGTPQQPERPDQPPPTAGWRGSRPLVVE